MASKASISNRTTTDHRDELCMHCANFDIKAALTWERSKAIQQLNLGPFDEPIHETTCALCQVARQTVGHQDKHYAQTIRVKPAGSGRLMVERLNSIYYAVGFISATTDSDELTKYFADSGKTIEAEDADVQDTSDTIPPSAWYRTYDEKIALHHALSWMGNCDDKHFCGISPVKTLPGDAFFVDVCTLKIASGEERGLKPYFALSYVCGGHQTLELTTMNQHDLAKPYSLADKDLPKTYLDSMQFTQRCGIQYLWIDFLCIMHDDEGSNQNQVDAMDRIYSEASLVLVAALGSSPRFGLYPASIVPRKVQGIWIHISRGDSETEPFAHLEDIMTAIYWTRSWCFQEQFLSTRRLYFGAHWLRFHCKSMDVTGHVDAFGAFKIQDVSQIENTSPYDHSWAMRTLFWASRNSSVAFPDLFRAYGTIVQGFTERELTYPEDIERAFAGIASLLKRINGNLVVAGIPSTLLPHALLWYTWRTTTPAKQLSTAHFPTWSWMSAACAVSYSPLHNGADEESEMLYELRSLVTFSEQQYNTGLSDGILQFDAQVISATHFRLRPRQVDVLQSLGLQSEDYGSSEADSAEFEARGIYFPEQPYNAGQVKGIIPVHEACFAEDSTPTNHYVIVALTGVGSAYFGLLLLQNTDAFIRVGLVSMQAAAFDVCDPHLKTIRLF